MQPAANVLVLDGNERSALAITRCLGRHGVRPLVGAESSASLAGASRHCRARLRYTSPYQDPSRFIADIDQLIAANEIGCLLPATDVTTLLLARHRDRWPATRLPTARWEQIDLLSNKAALFRLAEDLGIPSPRTHYIDSPAAALTLADDLDYPAVLKPFRSRILRDDGWLGTAVRIAPDAATLRDLVSTRPEFRDYPFLVQEFISGEGAGYFALYDHDTLIADFCHLRLREKPPSGGVSVLSESSQVDPRLREHARRLFNHTGWHGVAMVEFKLGADGTPYLMEVNTRFWGSLQLAIDAGLEFPWLLYRMACGEQVEPPGAYEQGRRLRWLLGDLDRLSIVLRSRDYGTGDKLRQLATFLNFFSPRTRFEVNRLGDLRPGLFELRRYLGELATALRSYR